MRFARRLLLAAALCGVAGPALAARPTPCRVDGLAHEVLCGQVQRALDPARPEGVQIEVHYVVVPALARRKLPDPVFLLAGGPGQSAIALAGQVMPLFARLNHRRDIVFVDQRGTGRSAPLVCDDPRQQHVADQADPERQLALLRECRQTLQRLPYGDLRFFTTPIAMQDLDAVRRALGAERIDLVGASYGTRAGLDYLRQFPHAVRRAVLDGVAPPDMALPASFSTDGQAAFEAVLKGCEADAACTRLYPGLRPAWAAWLARLPQPVTVRHPLSGEPEHFTLTREMALGAVRGALYSPVLARALPAALHAAVQGQVQGLLTLGSRLTARPGTGLAMGMHFSVVCSEDLARLAQSTDAPGADFGADGVRLYQRACAGWPRGELPAAFYSVPATPVATLLLSGGLDPATPPRHGERVARALGPKARHVVVPNAGHGVMGLGCMPELMQRFIDTPGDDEALALDMRCVQAIPRPPVFRPITLEGAP
ncbi:MAG: alpha/beta fold hydrolase [Rhizobacter sp.]|nr:alpha/beta fold hydrolase [Rhizobacter sp.]